VILPPAADRFTFPVLAGVRVTDKIEERRDRVQRMLRLTGELGDQAAQVSEIDVSDRDNLKVTQPWEGRIVTLHLGDHNFALRYRNFLNNFSAIKAAPARRGKSRPAPRRSNHGGGMMPQKTQLAVGLDVGASRTRCVICALDGEYIRYLGHGLRSRRLGARALWPIRKPSPNRSAPR
jgi:hypothetical protein